jgi:hypothetical protein
VIPGLTVVHLAGSVVGPVGVSTVCGQFDQTAFVFPLRDFPETPICSWCRGGAE